MEDLFIFLTLKSKIQIEMHHFSWNSEMMHNIGHAYLYISNASNAISY